MLYHFARSLHLANLRLASGGIRSARTTGQLFALEVEEEDSTALLVLAHALMFSKRSFEVRAPYASVLPLFPL